MSKKRKREPEPSMIPLAAIYDKLASEHEEDRLRAAQSLLEDFEPRSTSTTQIKGILTRLFRGLCSSRKAARLGFSVALTEYLIEVHVQRGASVESGVPVSSIVDILDNETIPEGNTSGQDERDHYFGRLFGAEAVIKSNLVVHQQDLVQWKRLLDIICGIANTKPWLKQECGWVLYSCIKTFSLTKASVSDDFALDVVEKLTAHKLIRTPEGLAIWLEVMQAFPDANLPKDIWKHKDPLSRKDITLLADVLKDAKPHGNLEDGERKSQGKAMWSAQLHFVWDVVLARLYKFEELRLHGEENGAHGRRDEKIVDMKIIWTKAVDESLLVPTSSAERKHWGLLLFSKVLAEAPKLLLDKFFSQNAMSCLINALQGKDRYLQRTAQKALQSLQKRIEAEPMATAHCLKGLLLGTNYVDFDKLTRTKTVEKMITTYDPSGMTACMLERQLVRPGVEDPSIAAVRRKEILALQSKLVAYQVSSSENCESESQDDIHIPLPPALLTFQCWSRYALFAASDTNPSISPGTRILIKGRLFTHLEQALKTSDIGQELMVQICQYIQHCEDSPVVDFNASIKRNVQACLRKLCEITPPKTKSSGLSLLYCLVILQVYSGEAEAAEILGELLQSHEQLRTKECEQTSCDSLDALIEILLSFASKPSKFLRRVTNLVFENIASQITNKGLQSLVRILEGQENSEGQQEMFEATEAYADTEDEAENIGSDVEVVSVSSDSSSEHSEHNSDNGAFEDDVDEELAAFDAKLAAALGTKKLNGGVDYEGDLSVSSASDADMDDEQMMVLDDKLAEVFRARQQETSKKRERKDAKENIVNFKNRVLDLIDIYLKVESLSSHSLELVLPLLRLARMTKTKQLADRSCNVLNDFCRRCKGVNVPVCHDALVGVELLRSLHAEAGAGASNAHANAASHASILVVKSLVNGGVKIGEVVDVYAATQKRMLTEKKCKVQAGLFTDWNNWCVSARERFAE